MHDIDLSFEILAKKEITVDPRSCVVVVLVFGTHRQGTFNGIWTKQTFKRLAKLFSFQFTLSSKDEMLILKSPHFCHKYVVTEKQIAHVPLDTQSGNVANENTWNTMGGVVHVKQIDTINA